MMIKRHFELCFVIPINSADHVMDVIDLISLQPEAQQPLECVKSKVRSYSGASPFLLKVMTGKCSCWGFWISRLLMRRIMVTAITALMSQAENQLFSRPRQIEGLHSSWWTCTGMHGTSTNLQCGPMNSEPVTSPLQSKEQLHRPLNDSIWIFSLPIQIQGEIFQSLPLMLNRSEAGRSCSISCSFSGFQVISLEDRLLERHKRVRVDRRYFFKGISL